MATTRRLFQSPNNGSNNIGTPTNNNTNANINVAATFNVASNFVSPHRILHDEPLFPTRELAKALTDTQEKSEEMKKTLIEDRMNGLRKIVDELEQDNWMFEKFDIVR